MRTPPRSLGLGLRTLATLSCSNDGRPEGKRSPRPGEQLIDELPASFGRAGRYALRPLPGLDRRRPRPRGAESIGGGGYRIVDLAQALGNRGLNTRLDAPDGAVITSTTPSGPPPAPGQQRIPEDAAATGTAGRRSGSRPPEGDRTRELVCASAASSSGCAIAGKVAGVLQGPGRSPAALGSLPSPTSSSSPRRRRPRPTGASPPPTRASSTSTPTTATSAIARDTRGHHQPAPVHRT